MRDIPLFTTLNGVASLYLKKIPYTKEAFVHIRDSLFCKALVSESVDFCRMVGAEHIYATGHEDLCDYPLRCTVLRYCIDNKCLFDTDAVALPTTAEQKDWWRDLYNQKMLRVLSASPLSLSEAEDMIRNGSAFCVYRECSVIGIGVAYNGQIQAVASIVPGGGRDTVLALAKCLGSSEISLTVASTNHKAIALYESIGFVFTGREGSWYQIF